MVFVLSVDGKPLMPCSDAKARHLCRKGKACRVKNTPFTIRLKFVVDGHTEPITLGVDPGYGFIGLSASTEDKVLYEVTAECRTDIPKLLTSRLTLRRSRRNRKTRHRQARFNNRKASKPKSWLPPSVNARLDYHMRLIDNVCQLLPITKIVVEVASFDIQQIRNPDIQGVEYQQGRLYQSNLRSYVYAKFGGKCVVCGKRLGDGVKWSMHHIHMRRNGATDNPDEFAPVCVECHTKPHSHDKGGKLYRLMGKLERVEYKDATFMNMIRKHLYYRLIDKFGPGDVGKTYGHITSNTRNEHNLPKEHYVDARCIAGHSDATPTDTVYRIVKHRCHNRKLHKEVPSKGGRRPLRQSARVVFGFRLFDIVRYNNKSYCILGRRTTGYFHIKGIHNDLVIPSVNYNKLLLVERSRTITIVSAPPTR